MHPKLDEKKVCFVTPPSAFTAYTGTAINAATQLYPLLQYQYLSAWLKEKLRLGFKTSVLDMGIEKNPWLLLGKFLLQERPKYLGLSVTTPLFYEANLIGLIAKDLLGPELVLVHGGVHPSALPEESLTEAMCDAVVVGEGEETFGEICQGKELRDVSGIVYRSDNGRRQVLGTEEIVGRLSKGEPCFDVQKGAVISGPPDIRRTAPRPYIRSPKDKTLDDLPFPDMELYNIWRYKNPDIVAHGYPMQQVETSRGCPYGCSFCSAEKAYRAMSPDYVIELYKYLISCGIREIRVIDDQFLLNFKRGRIIVEKMLQSGIKVLWNMANGVRADRLNKEFLLLAARSGCYQIGSGFESGDQEALDSLHKSLDLQKSLACAQIIKDAGIELVGFFMFAAPADTEMSMQKTIDFAKMLMPDFAKVTICTPFPDTELFRIYEQRGLILSRKWDDYNIHRVTGVFKHPQGLTPAVIRKYYWKFYRQFYFRPRYLWWKGRKSVADGSFFRNTKLAGKVFLAKLIPDDPRRYVIKTKPPPV